MRSPLTRFRTGLIANGLLALVFAFAVWKRVETLPGLMVLQDAVGPFWAALRMDGRAHAEPYGVSILLPYVVLVHLSGSLWAAMKSMAFVHGFAAYLVARHGLRKQPEWVLAAIFAGILVGLDPGLIDTFRSGAEGYLAPLFIGLTCFLRGPKAWVVFAIAIGNHPLSVAAAPLILRRENVTASSWWGMLVFSVLVAGQAMGWNGAGVDGHGHGAWTALYAYVNEGGPIAIAILLGPCVGLIRRCERGVAVRTLLCFLFLFVMGEWLGYLRDHHIRLLTIPAVACWWSLGRIAWVPMFIAMSVPHSQDRPPESGRRASTLGLVKHLGEIIEPKQPPMVVDRVWLSGDPGLEPAALMLDLHLRGWGPISSGDSMVVVLAGNEDELRRAGRPQSSDLVDGHGYTVFEAKTDSVFDWSQQFCGTSARLGGAWDALSTLEPANTTETVGLWWACP